MIRDADGNKVFENYTEAMFLLGEWSAQILGWLKELRDEHGVPLPLYPYYRSRLHDMTMVTRRFLAACKNREDTLREKLQHTQEDELCPRCRKPKQTV